MKQMRIAECKCNSLAPYSGKEANGKIEYYPEYNLVEFNLNQARIVQFGEIE